VGEGSASLPGSSLPPGKTRYPLHRRLGGRQGRSGQVRKITPPPGFDLRTVQPVASRYTDYAARPTCWSYRWYMLFVVRLPVTLLMVLSLMTDNLVLKCQLLASFHCGAKDTDECYAFTVEFSLWSCISHFIGVSFKLPSYF